MEPELISFDIHKYGGSKGAFITCDLRINPSIAWCKKYALFPLICNRETVSYTELTQTQKDCMKSFMRLTPQFQSSPKLLLTFRDKVKFQQQETGKLMSIIKYVTDTLQFTSHRVGLPTLKWYGVGKNSQRNRVPAGSRIC